MHLHFYSERQSLLSVMTTRARDSYPCRRNGSAFENRRLTRYGCGYRPYSDGTLASCGFGSFEDFPAYACEVQTGHSTAASQHELRPEADDHFGSPNTVHRTDSDDQVCRYESVHCRSVIECGTNPTYYGIRVIMYVLVIVGV